MANDEENGSRSTEEERKNNGGMTKDEEKAHKEIHENMSNQELQNLRDHIVKNTAEGNLNEFAQKEEKMIRDELSKRPGGEVKTNPGN